MSTNWQLLGEARIVNAFSKVSPELLSTNDCRKESSVWGTLAGKLLRNTYRNRNWFNLIWRKNRHGIRAKVLKTPGKKHNLRQKRKPAKRFTPSDYTSISKTTRQRSCVNEQSPSILKSNGSAPDKWQKKYEDFVKGANQRYPDDQSEPIPIEDVFCDSLCELEGDTMASEIASDVTRQMPDNGSQDSQIENIDTSILAFSKPPTAGGDEEHLAEAECEDSSSEEMDISKHDDVKTEIRFTDVIRQPLRAEKANPSDNKSSPEFQDRESDSNGHHPYPSDGKTKPVEAVKEQDGACTDEEEEFSFQITAQEWENLGISNSKSKMPTKYVCLFADKFKAFNQSCVLSFGYSHLKKRDSRKRNSQYFRATAHCTHSGCARYVFSILEEPTENAEVLVIKKGKIKHTEGTFKKRKLEGEARRAKAEELKSRGISNTYYKGINDMPEDALKAGNITSCQTREVLRKALSEALQLERIHENVFLEVCLIKDILAEEDNKSKKIMGYIRYISVEPFVVGMFTEEQILLMNELTKSNECNIYFDATGTVVSKIKPKGRPILYYAIVIRHKDPKQPPVPLAELLSEDQSAPTITHFLLKIRHSLASLGNKHPRPNKVEVDFSWALINSVLLAYNQEDASKYLLRCWETMTGKKCFTPSDNTVVHLCSAHMLKAAQQQINRVVKNVQLQEFSLRVFALLQNTTGLRDARIIWQHFVNISMSVEKNEHTEEGINFFKRKMLNWGNQKLKEENSQDDTSDVNIENSSQPRNLRDHSPFTQAFLKTSDIIPEQQSTGIHNEYFCPESAKVIETQYLHLFPLWSGGMLGDLTRHSTKPERPQMTRVTRDTNAAVENWFRIMKHNNLQGKLRLRVGTFIRKSHINLKGRLKAFRYGLTRSSNLKVNNCKKPKEFELEDKDFTSQLEMWQKSSSSKSDKKSKYFSPPKKFPTPNVKNKMKERSCKIPVCGLRNEGNTCWLNSSIQAFNFTAIFQEARLVKGRNHFIDVLTETLDDLKQRPPKNPMSLTKLLEEIERDRQMKTEFTSGEQHDAAAFVGFCLEQLLSHRYLKPLVVQGHLTCLNCRKARVVAPEEFTLLQVPIVTDESGNCSIQGCLNSYFQDEILSEKLSVNCQKCQHATPHEKQSTVMETPESLIVQLKRFDDRLQKKEHAVAIQRIIRISIGCDGNKTESVWELQSVQCHRGRSLQSGHYVTVGLNGDSVSVCDDEKVYQRTLTYLDKSGHGSIRESCYLLFYKRSNSSSSEKTALPVITVHKNEATDMTSNFLEELRSVSDDRLELKAVNYHISGEVLKREDVQSLFHPNWLNDKVVNSFFILLQKTHNAKDEGKIFSMPSFLPVKWKSEDYTQWMYQKVNLSQYVWIFVPINIHNKHWVLLAANVPEMSVSIFDSLGDSNKAYVDLWRKYMTRRAELTGELAGHWKISGEKSVLQDDGSSCGPFVLLNALALTRNIKPASLSSQHAIAMRPFALAMLLSAAEKS